MELCKGYEIRTVSASGSLSTHFAVSSDGVILESIAHVTDVHFDKPGRLWRRVDTLPERAEFIGTYAMPRINWKNFS